MTKILLSAGHGAGKSHNRGALYYNEGDNNYYFSLVLKKELETYNGITVDLIRKNINDNPNLAERSAMGKGYDLYYSIHSNAIDKPSVRGTEVWDSVEKPNISLAQAICDATAKLFNHNNRKARYREGQPGYNWYGELRFNQAKSSMIIENGFHTNAQDCRFFKDNHEKIAEVQAKVIANYYGVKKKNQLTPILSKPTATIEQMKEWAKSKKASPLFIELAPTFYRVALQTGVNPVIAYAQSAKETGYFRFGGVLDASYCNPCGMKTRTGGGDYDKHAHQKFKTWEEGITAQVHHLALYANADGFPKSNSPDPRNFVSIKGTAITVESLGGKWAGSLTYGTDIVRMMKEIESTRVISPRLARPDIDMEYKGW